ncbi:MAG: CotH kinase family protein [Ruminococcus sp.]|uniref:CotH kinase family protein n=1 Tax=Ruminococcus sp. TaxID=41978 RepID=UPI0025E54C15|nr:CotH kinase family protein [Ruminococcus sp.]MBR5682135.1 CotH kinase family protein [Ruminococcus sp.]
MKNIRRIIALSLVTVMLFGCTSEKRSAKKGKKSERPVYAEAVLSSADSYEAETVPLSVLSIETKSKDKNAMDFYTEPVAAHVVKLLNSWGNECDAPAPYYVDCTVSLKGSDGNVQLSPADAQVKVRGNFTTMYPKKPLRIKFAEKQNLLGLNEGSAFRNWLLLAEYKDCSMLRNKATLYAARHILGADGLYAADADFVRVEINGEYMGLYLLTEMQQTDRKRVNATKPKGGYTGTDIGYFLEFDGYFENEDDLHKFPIDYADNAALKPYDGKGGSGRTKKCLGKAFSYLANEIGFTIKSDINSQEQHDFIANYINNVYKIMYEAAYNHKAFVFDDKNENIAESSELTPQQAVEKVVDVDSLVDMYILNELACDADVSWSSFYMDIDFSPEHTKRLTFEAPWDFDSAMGNMPCCIDSQGFYASNIIPDSDSINPWFVLLAYEDWYQEMIKEKWTKAYDNGVFARVCQMVESDKEVLEEEFEDNYKKWKNNYDKDLFIMELSPAEVNIHSEKESAEHLLEWLQKRIDFLNSQWHK